ncbi:hypothetical protein SAMN05428642_104103 [Flaviramulus basaltis]|uniref:STAS/SEC14 domain-containing protein n=1 Tax=Flaviramulus basaltis TaxID=369401 RepID=A0A1K2IPI6_9FLAO|nr:hypothetical protein [Flaviramulus basaltis]SFZ94345.1 hypothetical protein SAMN05428642_104103 [Flaviramulus basaltis]
MKKTLKLPVGTFYIYNDYLIVEANEGETVTVESNDILVDIADTYYSGKEFVYITNRINSYSVDPAVYSKTSLITNLVGFAVVATNYISLSNAEIEKLFLSKPFESFTELEKAISWAKSIIKQNNTNIKTSDF